MAEKPKSTFYLVVAVVIIGLVVFALYRSDLFAPKGGEGQPPEDITAPPILEDEAYNAALTTVQEWQFVPTERLPEVRGTSAYRPLENNTIRFALNVWAGWAPIILANEGFQAGHVWRTPAGEEFRVELVLIDDPVAMRDAYAAGEVHVGWATLDMVPLFLEGFVDSSGTPRDSRVMPRIYQQIDWSNGGDGIIVRESIRTVSDLRGRQVVLAQNSPSQYFLLNMLVYGGLQPHEVQMVFTQDAFQAAAAFNAQSDIAAAVSWAPDIYNLAEAPGNRMLVTTQTANRLIADVWFARADFARDHQSILEGLVRGIFDSMELLYEDEAQRRRCAELMAAGYNLPVDEALGMMGDAHWTNWAENYQFLVNRNNPTGFQRVWDQAYSLYRRIGSVTHTQIPFDQVMDFSIIQQLGQDPRYANQVDRYQVQFTPRTVNEITAAESPILTQTVSINFYPNSWDLHHRVVRQVEGRSVEELYDPNVEHVLEEIARLAGEFGLAQIVISGHTDSSMRGQVPENLVVELSERRANAVRDALVQQYQLDPNQFAVRGAGWSEPADRNDPFNHAKNRRVEAAVYPAEGM
ncbi:MAG: OmpA family protein [Bradymonadales bacterium]|nr:OmpA family protein [Bradymonadales bacterium]